MSAALPIAAAAILKKVADSGPGKAVIGTIKDTASDIVHKPLKGLVEGATLIGSAPAGIFGQIAAKNTAGNVADGGSIMTSTQQGVQQTMDSTGAGALLMGKTQLPNIAIQDPSAVNAANAAQRAAASRQAQIDQQTGAPGRGGTILTDNYNYRT